MKTCKTIVELTRLINSSKVPLSPNLLTLVHLPLLLLLLPLVVVVVAIVIVTIVVVLVIIAIY